MPRKQRNCEAAVKQLAQSHTKCTKHTPAKIYDAGVLIEYFGGTAAATAALSQQQSWRVCSGLSQKVNKHVAARLSSSNIAQVCGERSPTQNQSGREVGGGEEPTPPVIFEEEKNDSSATKEGVPPDHDDDGTPSKKKLKRSHTDVYVESLLEKSTSHRFPYRKLVSRERARRVNFLAETVLAACVDRNELKKYKDEYLEYNEILAQDALTVLDEMKAHIQGNLKINLRTLEKINLPTPLLPPSNISDESLNDNILSFALR